VRKEDFVGRRQKDWTRLNDLLDRVQSLRLHGMSHAELAQIRVLYRRAAGDLAIVQTQLGDYQLEDYLNDLVARGHGLLYTPRRRRFREGLAELYYSGAEALRRRMLYVLFAVGVFLIGAALGAILIYSDRSLTAKILPGVFYGALEQWKSGRHTSATAEQMLAFTMQLNVNNTRVALICFASGILWGIPTLLLTIYNGMMIGVFVVELASANQLDFFIVGVLPHGVTELSAIFFAAGGGFMLAQAVIAPGDRTRADALRETAKDAFWMLIVAVVLLIEAAIVEANFSHSSASGPIKLGFAATALVLLVAYIYGVRRSSAPSTAMRP